MRHGVKQEMGDGSREREAKTVASCRLQGARPKPQAKAFRTFNNFRYSIYDFTIYGFSQP
jgi:hypothetical protein